MNDFTQVSSESLCEKFGLDSVQRQQRLELLDLVEGDHLLAAELLDGVIEPNLDEIIERFYSKIMSDPVAQRLIDSDDLLSHLKKTQAEYLLTLGIGFDTEAYFESRLRAGLAHAWVGLPLTTYQCGFHIQQHLILSSIRKTLPEGRFEALLLFLLKIVSLDMSLAIEAYHNVQVQGLTRSIEKMKDHQRALQDRVSIDSLTAVFSRSQIMEELERSVSVAGSSGESLSIIMLDLDFFKQINDSHGHHAGDLVLKQVANRFRASIRDADMVGRVGGEEFLAILPGADMATSLRIAERIRAHTSSSPVKYDEGLIDVSVSGGVTTCSGEDDPQSLLERADKALYRAKEEGRNRVVYLDAVTSGPS